VVDGMAQENQETSIKFLLVLLRPFWNVLNYPFKLFFCFLKIANDQVTISHPVFLDYNSHPRANASAQYSSFWVGPSPSVGIPSTDTHQPLSK
jgi:hypothetical protein